MIKVLVSACLLGERVRYHGGEATSGSPILASWLAEHRIVPFCPEVAGGLGVPRPAAEIRGAGGPAVLDGAAHVVTAAGADVGASFLHGARLALDIALAEGVRLAVLKEGSPSCGTGFIYDGSFTGGRRAGQGVTAALLERHGLRAFSELEIGEAAQYLRELEAASLV